MGYVVDMFEFIFANAVFNVADIYHMRNHYVLHICYL